MCPTGRIAHLKAEHGLPINCTHRFFVEQNAGHYCRFGILARLPFVAGDSCLNRERRNAHFVWCAELIWNRVESHCCEGVAGGFWPIGPRRYHACQAFQQVFCLSAAGQTVALIGRHASPFYNNYSYLALSARWSRSSATRRGRWSGIRGCSSGCIWRGTWNFWCRTSRRSAGRCG